ncbi:MAG: TauD/TfdA family dioxygenase [Rhodospirillaceae bacterium]|jgi:taurine dioxygenase|nr:TauD/TfdA family dioxygenase [Rhodospirillaceae bacterium]MBT6116486.1 TauD/TfdA family dioxygenase [Rhodospirillaceae bacterium]
MSRISVKPMPGAFGVEVEGVDLSRPLDAETERAVMDAFHGGRIMAIRGQKLVFDEFDRFTRRFGDQDAHFLDHLRLLGHPAILMLSNIFEDGKPVGVFEGAAFWHTDVAYRDPPNSATIVYALECPAGGCPTHFADMYAAYDDLPQAVKDRIDGLKVIHHYGNRDDMDEDSPQSAERLTAEQKKKVRNVVMPLVRTHHVTGRKALYGVAGSSFHIVDMPDDEALDLLDSLKEHALQPKYLTAYDYAAGDVVAWDTYATLHKATLQKPATKPEDRRVLWRVSVTGKPQIFRDGPQAT